MGTNDRTGFPAICALFAASFLLGPLPALFAVAMACVGRNGAADLRWQMRSFGFGLLLTAIDVLSAILVVGVVGALVAHVWLICRAIEGRLRLNEKRVPYAMETANA